MTVTVPERVIARILRRIAEDDNGCWIWPGALAGGYGHVGWDEATVHFNARTHRALYEHFVGPIPAGLDLDHLCRVRSCCNPKHLEPVTRQVNLLRGETTPARRAAVTHCPRDHEYTPENTRVDKKNRRICKQCARLHNRAVSPEKKREYNARARAKAKAKAA